MVDGVVTLPLCRGVIAPLHGPFSRQIKVQLYLCFAHLKLANQYSVAILFHLFFEGICVDRSVVAQWILHMVVELDVHIESTCNIK